MDGIRIVELPKCQMVSSGISMEKELFAADGKLMRFCAWWNAADKNRKDKFFPRDFMWYDRTTGGMMWWYACAEPLGDTGGYELVDFAGGLYAAAISRDHDEADGNRVYESIKRWVNDSGCFALDERPGHYDMFHIITSDSAYKVMGYRQLDIYVPIRVK